MKKHKSYLKASEQLIALIIAFVLVVNLVPVQVQAEVVMEHAPVTVYLDSYYENTYQELTVGEYDIDALEAGVGNDEISSIRIAQGYQVTLYTNSGFAGNAVVLTQDELNFKNLGINDEVSSLKIEQINPVDGTCIQISGWTDAEKVQIMQNYAPRIWMAEGEVYWPSSVEYALPYLTRTWDDTNGYYYYATTEPLADPETKLNYFAGNINSAKCYSFWVEKDYNNVDISYFQFCPYNYGKKVLGMEFGNHVGDWEHITIRFAKFTYNGVDYMKPIQVRYPTHSFASEYNWADVEKVEGTHLVGYSAEGSHGMWKDAGDHEYQNIVIAKLTDECSAGTAWNTWTCLETYEYSALTRTGRGLGSTEWKTYFDVDYQNADSLSVYEWGNKKNGSVFGQDKLGNGPTGPQEKWALSHYTKFD